MSTRKGPTLTRKQVRFYQNRLPDIARNRKCASCGRFKKNDDASPHNLCSSCWKQIRYEIMAETDGPAYRE